MQLSIAQRFRNAVRNFIHSPENSGKKTDKSRARKFIEETEPDLARVFLLDHVEGMMRTEERAADRETRRSQQSEDPQMRLLGPGFAELFKSVRQRLPLKSGTRIMGRMTVSELRESAAVLRAQAKQRAQKHAETHLRRAEYLEGIADAMSPWAQVHRGVSVDDYLELKAAGVAPGVKANAGAAR